MKPQKCLNRWQSACGWQFQYEINKIKQSFGKYKKIVEQRGKQQIDFVSRPWKT